MPWKHLLYLVTYYYLLYTWIIDLAAISDFSSVSAMLWEFENSSLSPSWPAEESKEHLNIRYCKENSVKTLP